MGGALALFVERKLCCFALCELRNIPVARGGDATRASFVQSVYKDHRVTLAVETDLEQQRRIDDERECVAGRRREVAQTLRVNARMHDRFDLLTHR